MVLNSFWQNVWDGIVSFFNSIGNFFLTENEYGLSLLTRIIIAIAVLVAGVLLIKLIVAILKKASGIKKGIAMDISAKSFFIGSFKIFLYFVLAFVIVGILGINVTGAVGILSAVTVALGLALQDIIGMFASGVLLFYTKNIHTGDYVKVCNSFGSEEGKVYRISLLYTTLLSVDGQKIHIPNNNMTKANVTNYSDHDFRRGNIFITISYDAESDEVLKTLLEVADKNEKVLKDPASFSYINNMKEIGVEYGLRFYTSLDDYWDTLYALRNELLKAIKEKGYKIAIVTSISVSERKEEE